MPKKNPCLWQQWRVKLVERSAPKADALETGFVRRPPSIPGTRSEQPGPDGIRHGLVARIRQEIAAGTYDTEERWLAAEEMLLSRLEAGA
ncbi:MAG TPA: hypothetical protein VGL71_13905 [Urbifossiella sp.]|jgi:hypothetical protein